jgi:hypothetical protein
LSTEDLGFLNLEKAKYVVEVIGGLCDMLMIEEGDYIAYEKQ